MTGSNDSGVSSTKRPKAILCLCHDDDMLRIRRMLLEHFGYLVLPSTSAEDAKSVVEQRCPDMILMDNGGHAGFDYKGLAQQVKSLCPDVITVVLSPHFRLSVNGSEAIDRFVAQDDGPNELIAQIKALFAGDRQDAASV